MVLPPESELYVSTTRSNPVVVGFKKYADSRSGDITADVMTGVTPMHATGNGIGRFTWTVVPVPAGVVA